MEEKVVTITVSEHEAELILRSIKARLNHWRSPEQVNRISNSNGIRLMYKNVLDKVEDQVDSQIDK